MKKSKPKVPKELVEPVMFALAHALAYSNADFIVRSYLEGKDVAPEIGRRGVWHFDYMMRTMGCALPRPATPPQGGEK